TGLPGPLDREEPQRVADAVAKLELSHVVVTSVDRDDLSDGGARHFAEVICAIRASTPSTTIEVLTPDFLHKEGALEIVVAARPDVYNHNLETVPSLYLTVRPGGTLLRFVAPVAAGERARSAHVHQVGHDGGSRRGAQRGNAVDGRFARSSSRFSDHRTIP